MKAVIGILMLSIILAFVEYPFVMGMIQQVTSKLPGR